MNSKYYNVSQQEAEECVSDHYIILIQTLITPTNITGYN